MGEEYERKHAFLDVIVEGQHKYLLHFAVQVENLEAVEAAIRLGYGVEVEDEEERTPMYLAALGGKRTVMNVLRKRGGDVGRVLALGASRGQRAVIEHAVSCGAEVNRTDQEGRSPLYRAAEGGHLDSMQLLLEKGAQLESLLHLAAARGHLPAARSLLSSGASVHGKDEEGRSPLYRAAQGGNQNIITMLLDRGADPSYLLHSALKAGDLQVVKHLMISAAARNRNSAKVEKVSVEEERKKLIEVLDQGVNMGSLHSVVRNGNLENLNWLLACGADVNYRDTKGYSPLYVAVEAGNVGMMQALLSRGAALEEEVEGKRLLHCAVQGKDRAAAEALLKARAEVNSATSDTDRRSSLHLAVVDNSVDLIDMLVRYGAAVDIKDGSDMTPLMKAAELGHVGSTRALLKGGASVNLKTGNGWTALHLAANNGHLEVVIALLDSGADIHAKSVQGNTALHLAAYNGHLEMVRALLASGANIHAKSVQGNTALHRAAYKGHLEVVRTLLDSGADIHALMNQGSTALHLAASNGHLMVVTALLSSGADIHAKLDDGRTTLRLAVGSGHDAVANLLRSWLDSSPRRYL